MDLNVIGVPNLTVLSGVGDSVGNSVKEYLISLSNSLVGEGYDKGKSGSVVKTELYRLDKSVNGSLVIILNLIFGILGNVILGVRCS